MKNLFYSRSESTLFWVAGYTSEPWKEDEIVVMLNKYADKFATETKCDRKEVKTLLIDKSSRYKNMRVFYVENYKRVPSTLEVFKIGMTPSQIKKASDYDKKTSWNMMSWLRN